MAVREVRAVAAKAAEVKAPVHLEMVEVEVATLAEAEAAATAVAAVASVVSTVEEMVAEEKAAAGWAPASPDSAAAVAVDLGPLAALMAG